MPHSQTMSSSTQREWEWDGNQKKTGGKGSWQCWVGTDTACFKEHQEVFNTIEILSIKKSWRSTTEVSMLFQTVHSSFYPNLATEPCGHYSLIHGSGAVCELELNQVFQNAFKITWRIELWRWKVCHCLLRKSANASIVICTQKQAQMWAALYLVK